MIQDLQIKCPNVERNCEWKGTVGTVDRHLTSCQFSLISCPKSCGENFLRKELDDHLGKACILRDYKCSNCGEEGTYADITYAHDLVCEKKRVHCKNMKCPQYMQRCEIEKHVETECEYTKVPCKYESIGCDMKIERKEIPVHQQDNEQHLHLALNTIVQQKATIAQLESSHKSILMQQQAMLQKWEEQQKSTIQKLEEQQESMMQKLEEQQELMVYKLEEQQESMIKKLEEEQKLMQDTVKNLAEQQDTLAPFMQRKLESFESSTKASVASLKGFIVNVLNLERISEFAVYQYEKKRRASKCYTSQPFYTSDEGYNLAVQVDTNGYGDSEGTHVSVYVLVKRGKNDSNLPWPFIGRINIKLLNQHEDDKHHSRTISMDAAQNMQVGSIWGREKFILRATVMKKRQCTSKMILFAFKFSSGSVQLLIKVTY